MKEGEEFGDADAGGRVAMVMRRAKQRVRVLGSDCWLND
jgi:hypothetical protein